jgi:glutaredoxin
MHKITLYTKPGCHLCDRAKEIIFRCRHQIHFDYDEINIETSESLNHLYCNDIPVILLDGREIARHFIRERNLLKLLL